MTATERITFFFSSRRRHTRSKRDWSSDVCSSDLAVLVVCSGLSHIEHPDLSMTHLPSGHGGVIGTFLGDTLMRTIGYGGAVIGLSLAGIASLVISGNLTVS